MLTRMHVEFGVSPWLDQVPGENIAQDALDRLVAAGIRGLRVGRPGFGRADGSEASHPDRFWDLVASGCTALQARERLLTIGAQAACDMFGSVYRMSQGADGFVSTPLGIDPTRRADGTVTAACQVHLEVDRPNVIVAIPAAGSGVRALREAVAAGCNVEAAAIFSIARYEQVLEAYQVGLEALVHRGGDPATVHGFASFDLGSIDAEVEQRIGASTGGRLGEVRGLAAVAQAMLVCEVFKQHFSSDRWKRLSRLGATPQRLIWAGADVGLTPDQVQRYLYVARAAGVPDPAMMMPASTITSLDNAAFAPTTPTLTHNEALQVLGTLHDGGLDIEDISAILEARSTTRSAVSLADASDQFSRWAERS